MPEELTSTLEDLDSEANGDELVVGDLVESFEHRGFGPMLLVPSLISLVPPISGIPGVPAVCGLLIMLISFQMIFGRSHPWVPDMVKKLSVSREKVEKMQEKGRPFTKRIDSLSARRLSWLTNPVSIRIISALMGILALTMIPLELVPFGAAAPAGTIALLSLGLMARDGVMILFGLLLSSSVVWIVAANWNILWPF
ncbi:MAG: exopolysaccharide biosynthesis protein [Verrucomicrobiota bacterium JB023]|nr:exopolysaccharide biosynthesis protein [Verrucomicrobiota bacterium JB023]